MTRLSWRCESRGWGGRRSVRVDKGCYDGEIVLFVGDCGFPGRGVEWECGGRRWRGLESGGGGVGRGVMVVKSCV